MKRITYIPDYKATNNEIAQQLNILVKVFDSEYDVSLTEIDFRAPKGTAMNQIEDLMYQAPDVIIANGLGCFFATLHCTESHCICINPKIASEDLPSELADELEEIRPSRQWLDEQRQRSDKRAWGVYASDSIKDDRRTMSYFYPHLAASDNTDITETFIRQIISPIVELLKNYEWYDSKGIHFARFGRVIDSVQQDFFQTCKEYVIPDSVHGIKMGVFQNSNLEKITINDYLEEIPANCFAGSSHLKSIEMHYPSLWKIGEGAFCGCTALSGKLDLRSTNIREIGSNAFVDTNITAIELPNSIRSCSESALPEGCKVILTRHKLERLLKADETNSRLKIKYYDGIELD